MLNIYIPSFFDFIGLLVALYIFYLYYKYIIEYPKNKK